MGRPDATIVSNKAATSGLSGGLRTCKLMNVRGIAVIADTVMMTPVNRSMSDVSDL